MKSKPFCPVGYEPVNDWIHKESCRRGHSFDRNAVPNNVYCDIFDDLANYLGNHDNDKAALAVCNVDGRIKPLPVKTWRQEPKKRLTDISTGYYRFFEGWAHNPVKAKVFIRADLHLATEIVPVATRLPPSAERPEPEKEAALILRQMLSDLKPGDVPPVRNMVQAAVMDRVKGLSERGFNRAFNVPEFDRLRRSAGESDKTISAKKKRSG